MRLTEVKKLPLKKWVKYHSGVLSSDRLENPALDEAASQYYRAVGLFKNFPFENNRQQIEFWGEYGFQMPCNDDGRVCRVQLQQRFNGKSRVIQDTESKTTIRELDYFVMRVA